MEAGAATAICCATGPQLSDKGGVDCEDCNIARVVPADDNSPTGVQPNAIDKTAAEALWRLSEKLSNLQFTLRSNSGEKTPMNFSEFETIQKIKKSAAAIRKHEKELAKQEKVLAENQLLAQRLGLDKNAEGQTLRAAAEAAVNSMRTKLAEMKATHNKFVHENGLRLELFPE